MTDGDGSVDRGAATTAWVPTTGGHTLCLQDVPAEGDEARPAAILFVHGLFSDARVFLRRGGAAGGGQGPARYFIERGYRALLGELRGHGQSRRPPARAWDFCFDDYADHDIPALIRAARARHDGPLLLLCHSMAGYAALAGLGLHPDLQEGLSGVCVLSAAVNDYSDGGLKKAALIRFGALAGALLGRFPARALKQGPSDEPGRMMRQFAAWARDGSFASEDGSIDYWQALRKVTVPVLSAVGEADVFHASPRRARKLVDALGSERKELLICGRSNGFSRDFGHVDVLRGRAAADEVLPRMHAFARSLGGAAAAPEAGAGHG